MVTPEANHQPPAGSAMALNQLFAVSGRHHGEDDDTVILCWVKPGETPAEVFMQQLQIETDRVPSDECPIFVCSTTLIGTQAGMAFVLEPSLTVQMGALSPTAGPAPDQAGNMTWEKVRTLPQIPRIVVSVQGGQVQNILAEHPVQVVVVDHDIEGVPESLLSNIPVEPGQRSQQAVISDFSVQIDPLEVQVFAMLAAHAEALTSPDESPAP